MSASASGIRAGRAYVELYLKGDISKGLDQAATRLRAWGASVSAVGRAVAVAGLGMVGAFAATVKSFADAGSAMSDLSARTGISVESLSSLQYAAEASGGSLEGVEHGLRHLSRAIAEAAGGSKEAQAHLAQLGLTAQQLQGLAPDEAFRLLGERLAEVPDQARKASLAMELLGRSGTELLPMFGSGARAGTPAAAGAPGAPGGPREGAGGGRSLAELEAQAKGLGVVMGTADAGAAKDFSLALTDLWKVLRTGVFQIGGALAPELRGFVQMLTQGAVTVVKFVKENKALVVTAATVAAGIAGAGVAITAVGGVFTAAGSIVGGVVAAWGALVWVWGAVSAAATAVGGAIAAVASGLGIPVVALVAIAAAAVAAVGAVLYFTGALGAMWKAGSTAFGNLKTTAVTAWGGIRDAMAGGDLGLAARIAWAGVKVAWLENTQWLQGAWAATVAFVTDAWATASAYLSEGIAFLGEEWDGFLKVVRAVWDGILAVARPVVDALQSAWQVFVDWFQATFGSLFEWFKTNIGPILKVAAAVGVLGSGGALVLAALSESDTGKNAQAHLQAAGDQAAKARQEAADARAGGPSVADGVAAAKKELADLVAAAKDASAAAQAKAVGPAAGIPTPGEIDLGARQKADVKGTFNAAVLGQVGPDKLSDIATASEETARNTRRMAGKLDALDVARYE